MLSLKSVKTQAVALALAGTVALSSVLGSGVASASPPSLVQNASFEATQLAKGGYSMAVDGWIKNGASFVYACKEWQCYEEPEMVMDAFKINLPADGVNILFMHNKGGKGVGLAGVITEDIIPIDTAKEYEFQASYFTMPGYEGTPVLYMSLYDSNGKGLRRVGTGNITAKAPGWNNWHTVTYKFNPSSYLEAFPDLAGVRLELKQGLATYNGDKLTMVAFDDVKFETVN